MTPPLLQIVVCEIQYCADQSKFFVGNHEVTHVNLIGTIVYISNRDKVQILQSKYINA